MNAISSARRAVWSYLGCALGLVIFVASILAAGAWAEHNQLMAIRERGAARLDLQAALLEQELSRYHYLPAAVRLNPDVIRLLEQPGDAGLAERVDRFLKALNQEAGASDLYLLNRDGKVIAASNWDKRTSFVGIDLSYRPYFQDALRTGVGRIYGIGTTTAEPGYYFAQAVDGGAKPPLGVAVVKVSLDRLESPWPRTPAAMVVDGDGVVILASRLEWKYRTLAPLSMETIQRIQATRQFEQTTLLPLDIRSQRDLGDGASVVTLADDGDRRRHELLLQERVLATSSWRVLLLTELDDLATVVHSAQAVVGFGLGSLVLLGLYFRQWRRSLRLERSAHTALERANLDLEQKMAERTADLLAAQDELVHASKLAALGQMAAGVTHELNQPLAALRTLSDNAITLLRRQRVSETEVNLGMIGQIVERMAQITTQLKVFARKPTGATRPIVLKPSIDHARMVVAGTAQMRQIDVDLEMQDPDMQAMADPSLLGQILVNLLSNALDAIGDRANGRVSIKVARGVGLVTIAVADNGPGIPCDVLPSLFEPFFTTKDPGAGLGLGLTICEGIARELGGSLVARNLPEGGAEFTIELMAPPAASGEVHV
ncbi:MAG: ATP-binding protein [Geminicoccaceae bacterium]